MFAYFSSVRLFIVLFFLFILFNYSRQSSWYSRQMLVRFVRLRCTDACLMWKDCEIRNVYEQDRNGQNVRKVSVQTKKNELFIRLRLYKNTFTSLQQSCFVSLCCFFLFLSFFLSYFICAFLFFLYTSICRQTLYIFRLDYA